jgi:hypothetical protein
MSSNGGTPLATIFSLFSGSGAKTDRKNQLAGYGDLNNVFNFALPNAEAGYKAGASTQESALSQLSAPSKYYSDLLSGDRSTTLQAVQPTIAAANAQTDAQKRGLATSGTARGGGTNATSQQLDTAKMASVDNAIAGVKTGAAAGATQVAGETSKIGDSQTNAALNLLGIGKSAAKDLTSLAGDSRMTSDALHNERAQQTSVAAATALDFLMMAGGGGEDSGGGGGGEG